MEGATQAGPGRGGMGGEELELKRGSGRSEGLKGLWGGRRGEGRGERRGEGIGERGRGPEWEGMERVEGGEGGEEWEEEGGVEGEGERFIFRGTRAGRGLGPLFNLEPGEEGVPGVSGVLREEGGVEMIEMGGMGAEVFLELLGGVGRG